MAKIDIISGFLGAGKTTLIKKLIKEAFQGEQVVLIENEFGEIGIDGGFLKEAGIEIREMNSGCICCSLVGDFGTALKDVVSAYHPDRILIEPSGVGKLSDVIKAVQSVEQEADIRLNSYTTMVDAKKCKLYMRNFGEFFNNQVEYAGTVILSRTDIIDRDKAKECVEILREINKKAAIITTPVEELDGAKILEVMEHPVSLEEQLLEEELHHHHEGCGCHGEEHEHHHGEACHGEGHGHHHPEGEHHGEGHGHHHPEEERHGEGHGHHHPEEERHGEGHGHHHPEDEHHGEGHGHHHHGEEHHGEAHEHHHHHGGDCGHDHHGHHHADEVFTSWGRETVRVFTKEELDRILATLSETEDCGTILRAKGMVPTEDGTWLYFDMVPQETEIRQGAPDYAGRLCVIGAQLKTDKLEELFGL